MRNLLLVLLVGACTSEDEPPPFPGDCSCDVDTGCSAGCSCDPECKGPGGGGGGSDNGAEHASCSCDPVSGESSGVMERCSGSSDGCQGFGLPGELACYADAASGNGFCRYPCNASEEGTQGSCPAGYTCVPTVEVDAAGNPWHVCR